MYIKIETDKGIVENVMDSFAYCGGLDGKSKSLSDCYYASDKQGNRIMLYITLCSYVTTNIIRKPEQNDQNRTTIIDIVKEASCSIHEINRCIPCSVKKVISFAEENIINDRRIFNESTIATFEVYKGINGTAECECTLADKTRGVLITHPEAGLLYFTVLNESSGKDHCYTHDTHSISVGTGDNIGGITLPYRYDYNGNPYRHEGYKDSVTTTDPENIPVSVTTTGTGTCNCPNKSRPIVAGTRVNITQVPQPPHSEVNQ